MPARSRLRGAFGVSLLVHLGLLLVPLAWWGALGLLGGGAVSGRGLPGPWTGDDMFLVSEIAPGVASPPPAARATPTPPPEETPPPLPDAVETAAEEPEVAPEPVPPVEPLPEPSLPAGEPVTSPGTGTGAPTPAAGTPDGAPGPASGAGSGTGAGGAPAVYVSPKPLVVGLLELPEPRVIEARLLISPEGRVIRVEPIDPDLDPALRAEVERVARSMRFVPGRRDGKPVEAWCTLGFASRGK